MPMLRGAVRALDARRVSGSGDSFRRATSAPRHRRVCGALSPRRNHQGLGNELIAATTAMFAFAILAFTFLSKEFPPELDEGDLWLRVKFPIGISLETAEPPVPPTPTPQSSNPGNRHLRSKSRTL